MILNTQQLIKNYDNYVDPKGKIARDVKNGKLFCVRRGLYETNKNVDGLKLAQFIYSPSYVSFEYVLSQWSIIPEAVYNTYTCATFNKRRKKQFTNAFGLYLYRDVPNEVFRYGVKYYEEDSYSYMVATKEKALCDMLYTITPMYSLKEFKQLLFEDLRIDDEELNNMDKEFIYMIAPLYHVRNLDWLVKYLKGEE